MAPSSFKPSLKFKYPKNRELGWKGGDDWLDDKKNDDGAEGLWRVHNNLYDVTKFIDRHPGGPMWLELTKGTDITEAFESHHLTTKSEKVLQTYFVRAAKTPRNSPFTFEDNGFFRTLKHRLVPILEKVPKNTNLGSKITIDILCLATFIFSLLAARFWSYSLGFFAGILLCFTTIASHNFFHKKDNFRMYYFDLSLMNFREWRITHALSHHLFPNTVIDFEVSFFEPYIHYLPQKKTWFIKYGSWVVVFFFWANLFLISFIKRLIQIIYFKDTRSLHWSAAVSFALPTVLYWGADQSFAAIVGMWLYIITCASSIFSLIAFNAAHHHPEIFHDGDTPRSADKYDWGIYQLDSVAERYNVNRSQFFVLTAFGEHGLHHIFPTIDHAALKYVHEEFQKVLKEFDVKWHVKSEVEMFKGQFLQLSKEQPNLKPPGGQ